MSGAQALRSSGGPSAEGGHGNEASATPGLGVGAAQAQPSAAALQALVLLARLHHVPADHESLAHALGKTRTEAITARDVLLGARHLGLKARLTRSSAERLSLNPLPALALMNDGRVVLLAQCDGQRVLFQAPGDAVSGGRPMIEPLDAFAEQWTGELILIASRASLAGELAQFDFSWFVPAWSSTAGCFGEVLVVSFFLQLFALVSPLFFQVVMDKVLVHQRPDHARRAGHRPGSSSSCSRAS